MTIINTYKNGNTSVTLFNDGTKVREYEGIPDIVHPESIDVKITNYCDLGCAYCHESSTTEGKHADLDKLLEVLSDLPSGVELAIGGGNPLSHPGLVEFLTKLKERGIYANLTVNQGHLKPYQDLIKYLIKDDLVKGLGISITSNNFKYVEPLLKLTDNIVYHLIAGVNEVEAMDKLISMGKCKVLVLGYKTFGFGVKYHNPKVEQNIRRWYMYLPKYFGKSIISFDNLAIEQLNVRRLFTDKGWDKFYMGDDFTFTMYIDAVKQHYAPTSRNSYRKSFSEYALLDYFKNYREKSLV
jgi:hypothetical protein